jgi:DNA helicase MCM8
MASALLSRFDLIFILLDRADEDHDRRISEHIMGMTEAASKYDGGAKSFQKHTFPGDNNVETLHQRLRRQCSQIRQQMPSIDPHIIRKYIDYARSHVFPVLSPEAAKVLQLMYLTMRSHGIEGLADGDNIPTHNSSGTIPVTTRHLESLIRLAQARARMELRSEVIYIKLLCWV